MPAASASRKASYCCSRPRTTSPTSSCVREVAVDLGLGDLRGLAQVGEVDGEPAAALDVLEQRERGLRVVHLREVVRDVRDEAERVVAPLPQPDLEQRLRAGRDPQLALPRALAGDQLGAVGVGGDRDRPGVRHRHRHRAQADHAGDAELLDDLAHGAGEGLPADVGLGAGSSRYGVPPVSRSARTTSRGAS